MTPEMIAIIAAAIALGGLMLTLFQMMNRRIDSLERRIDSMQQQQSGFAERLARVEGLVEAVRDMLTRAPAAP